MLLTKVKVGPFKSIEHPAEVEIEPTTAVFVGMNEAGKTAFLQALHKAASTDSDEQYDATHDYPRKDLTKYLQVHDQEPATVAVLTYRLSAAEAESVNSARGTELPEGFEFTVTHRYDNERTIGISVDEGPALRSVLAAARLSTDARKAAETATSIRGLAQALESVARTEDDDALLEKLRARIAAVPERWDDVLDFEVWSAVQPLVPKFLYFDEYCTLPGKVNLADLSRRVAQSNSNAAALEPKHKAVLALLRMAGVSHDVLANPSGYEAIKAKLEGISNSITDQVFEYWKQNENLEVEFDIRPDASDEAPFNNGPNLYIRIRNRRHRVTVPFDQRSRGFIWFFSFIVWFDSVQQQAGTKQPLILLLDEPGLSLHALAQADFLRYIDDLAKRHQVLYTTHSPFMVRSERIHQARMVEDRVPGGTVVTNNLAGADPRTLFPLQAALGYTVAQNLFISRKNLLVEGPADLLYLRFFSDRLEAAGRTRLRPDVTVVPAGGLDKIATFVALLGANDLQLAVVSDGSAMSTDPRLAQLVRDKLLAARAVLTYAHATSDSSGVADVEDLLSPALYLTLFSSAFAPALGKRKITEGDLPPGKRIVERLNRYLAANGISLRSNGGFNHYAVASHLSTHPPAKVDDETLRRFESLFALVNALFHDESRLAPTA